MDRVLRSVNAVPWALGGLTNEDRKRFNASQAQSRMSGTAEAATVNCGICWRQLGLHGCLARKVFPWPCGSALFLVHRALLFLSLMCRTAASCGSWSCRRGRAARQILSCGRAISGSH